MAKKLIEIEKEALSLSDHDRAVLAQHLIETLNKDQDEDVEELWLIEAERRYNEYKNGNIKSVTAEEAFREARSRLK